MGTVVVAGSSGLIGTALVAALEAEGTSVVRLLRPGSPPADNGAAWDPDAGTIDAAALEGADAVVNVAGAGVGDHRWTDAHKAAVLRSRVGTTALLAETLPTLSHPPAVFVSGSASGYYGDRGDDILDEDSGPGAGFLADVCRRWEGAAQPAAGAGIRTVQIRSGIVLSGAGGALGRLLLPFRLGLGGRIGSGRQWWSWISIHDEVDAIRHVIRTPGLSGPVNLTSPTPVRNDEFVATLGRVLRRPAFLPVPRFALRAALGDFADEGLLASQ
ncbi:MAG: TIGR01777 family oxidoreductase, partial [Actinomycetota bacterium]